VNIKLWLPADLQTLCGKKVGPRLLLDLLDLGSFVISWAAMEYEIPKLATNPLSNGNCFLIWMHKVTIQPRNFVQSFLNVVSSISSAGIWGNNLTHRSPECKSFIYWYNRLLFIHVTFVARATAWLAVYRIASHLQYLILIQVWGYETD